MAIFGYPLSNPVGILPESSPSVGGAILVKKISAKSEIIAELNSNLLLTEYRVSSQFEAFGRVDFQKADDDFIPAFLFKEQCLNVVDLGIELKETEIIQVFNRSDFEVWFILGGVEVPEE